MEKVIIGYIAANATQESPVRVRDIANGLNLHPDKVASRLVYAARENKVSRINVSKTKQPCYAYWIERRDRPEKVDAEDFDQKSALAKTNCLIEEVLDSLADKLAGKIVDRAMKKIAIRMEHLIGSTKNCKPE